MSYSKNMLCVLKLSVWLCVKFAVHLYNEKTEFKKKFVEKDRIFIVCPKGLYCTFEMFWKMTYLIPMKGIKDN